MRQGDCPYVSFQQVVVDGLGATVVIIVGNHGVGDVFHLILGISHGDAQPRHTQHLDVIARITHSNALLDRNTEKPAEVLESRALAHALGRELKGICQAKDSFNGNPAIKNALQDVLRALAHHRVNDVLGNVGRMPKNPPLDIFNFVTHPHECVVELPKAIKRSRRSKLPAG